jgi:hypothetical protein
MTDTIEHLRTLVSEANKSDHLYMEQAAALEFTRDYGAKLIAVVEAASWQLHDNPEDTQQGLADALAALEDEG